MYVEPKNVWFLLSRHDIRKVHEKLFSRRYERAVGCFTHFGFLSPKTFDSYFTDIMYVEFMRYFFLPIRANWWVLDSFSPLEPKNVWFLLSRHDVRQVHQKFSSRRYRASYLLFDSFRPPEPKNVWFLLSRHDIRKVHEKLFSRRYERAVGFFTHFGFLTQKHLIPTLQTSCTSNSWEIFFSPIRANWWVLDSFSPPEPKNVWFLLSRHDVRQVHQKFSSRR